MAAMLPGNFWEREYDLLLAILLPRLEQMAITGSNTAIDWLTQVGLAFDNALAHEAAARWAREQADELLKRLWRTTESSVGEIVANWIETPDATRGALEEALRPLLDDNIYRAANIAVTETTRAFAEGEDIAYREAGLPGIDFKPPAHPQCRCWVRPVRLPNGDWVVVWQTNRDELVCTRRIDTPWGFVDGCGALNNVVVSIGSYLGMSLSQAREQARGM